MQESVNPPKLSARLAVCCSYSISGDRALMTSTLWRVEPQKSLEGYMTFVKNSLSDAITSPLMHFVSLCCWRKALPPSSLCFHPLKSWKMLKATWSHRLKARTSASLGQTSKGRQPKAVLICFLRFFSSVCNLWSNCIYQRHPETLQREATLVDNCTQLDWAVTWWICKANLGLSRTFDHFWVCPGKVCVKHAINLDETNMEDRRNKQRTISTTQINAQIWRQSTFWIWHKASAKTSWTLPAYVPGLALSLPVGELHCFFHYLPLLFKVIISL